MAWLKSEGRLGAAACRTVEPAGSTNRMLQWQPLEASLTSGAQCVQDNRQLATHGDHFEQPLFPGEQGLCSFSIFDVGVLAIPLHDTPALVAQRHRPDQEPPKRPVGSSQASLELPRLTTVEEGTPVIHQLRQVLGMDRRLPAPAGRVL